MKLTPRQILIVLHDLLATAAAIVATFFLRFEGAALDERLHSLGRFLPAFLVYAAIVYLVIGLQRNKWRFTSLPDLYNLFRVSTVLAVSLLALDYVLLAPNVYGTFYFGKISILLYWFLQMFFLGGLRVAYRYFHYARTLQRVKVADATPTLVLGRAADAEVLLRSIESGAVKKIWPVGVLSPSLADRGQSIRGVRVLGDIEDLEQVVADLERRGERITRLILTPSALTPEARPESLLIRARKLGLSMSQLPSLDADGPAVQLAPVAVEDLLLRPSVKIDYRRLENFICARAIVVTGGGGSITIGSFQDNAMAPWRLTRPNEGRSPVTPQKADGQMMEPHVSLPMAKGTSPAATAAPGPGNPDAVGPADRRAGAAPVHHDVGVEGPGSRWRHGRVRFVSGVGTAARDALARRQPEVRERISSIIWKA